MAQLYDAAHANGLWGSDMGSWCGRRAKLRESQLHTHLASCLCRCQCVPQTSPCVLWLGQGLQAPTDWLVVAPQGVAPSLYAVAGGGS
jgi:hypothetical protein